jgi:hypothetical protein
LERSSKAAAKILWPGIIQLWTIGGRPGEVFAVGGSEMQKKKPRTLMIGVDFVRLEQLGQVVVSSDGAVGISSGSGPVAFPSGETGLSYARTKGPKTLVQFFDAPGAHALPAAAVKTFARVFGVDTNMRSISGERIAVSTVAEIRNYQFQGNTWSATFQPLWAREFHDVDESFEKVGWHEALLLLSARDYLKGNPLLLVVDAHLGELRQIARREHPVFGGFLLPSNIYLAYASADVASESPLNRLIAVCDAVSSKRLAISTQTPDLDPPAVADPRAPYRAWRHWQIEVPAMEAAQHDVAADGASRRR